MPRDEEILIAAAKFGQGLAHRKWELLYGGGAPGLMGHIADHALKSGGVVRGAITESLAAGPEIAHQGLHELVVVKDLFDRKKWMMEEADAFVVFPGGFGTLDEALEVITWKDLNCHTKPILFVNVGGFWQHQLKAFEEMAKVGMIRPNGLNHYRVCENLEDMWAVLDGASTVQN
jgi:uncharacterized protein (TIGR00730 family)